MFSHEDIWRAIDRLARAHGYSPSGLARKAGLDPTTFNKSKRHSADGKPRWPSTESLSKVLAVTGATMAELLSLMDEQDESAVPAPGAHIAIMKSDETLTTATLIRQDKSGVTYKPDTSPTESLHVAHGDIVWLAHILTGNRS